MKLYSILDQDLLDTLVTTPMKPEDVPESVLTTNHKNVPQNEYTEMSIAKLAGVDIPDIKIIELNKLDNPLYDNDFNK